jgi:hypothetical protein
MFSLLENPLAISDDRLFETVQGNKLDRVESGRELKIGDFTASISWFENESSLFLALECGDPLSD